MSKATISKLLEARGIKTINELSPEEQETVRKWQSVLSEDIMTVELIKTFCDSQVKIIMVKFASKGKSEEDDYLKACLHVYLNLLKLIEAPIAERESLEKHLTQLI